METHQIRYFLEVQRTLNFTRAAECCGVSQPSLSRAIQQLEGELGGPLFHRERRNTHLTALGRAVAPHLESAASQIARARREASDFGRAGHALNLGVTATVGPGVFTRIIISLRRSFPAAELAVVDCTAQSMAEMMKRGDLSVALFSGPTELEEGLCSQPLFVEPFEVAVSESHPLAALDLVGGGDLEGRPYLKHADCPHADAIGRALARRGVVLKPVVVCNRDDRIMAMVAAGLGFALTPRSGAPMAGVVKRVLVDPQVSRSVDLVTVRGRPHSPCVGALVRAARRLGAEGAPAHSGLGASHAGGD